MTELISKGNSVLRSVRRLTICPSASLVAQSYRNGSALAVLKEAKLALEGVEDWANSSGVSSRVRLEAAQLVHDLRVETRALSTIVERHELVNGMGSSKGLLDDGEADSILVRSRNALHKELSTVEEVGRRIIHGSENLRGIRDTLGATDTTLHVTQRKVRKLLAIKTVDDILFYISFGILVFVVLVVMYSRLFKFTFF